MGYLNIFQQVRHEIRGINLQFLRLIWDRICLRKPLSVPATNAPPQIAYSWAQGAEFFAAGGVMDRAAVAAVLGK